MKLRRHREVLDADQAAEKAQQVVLASAAVLAAALEDHQAATNALRAAIEEQRKGWSDV